MTHLVPDLGATSAGQMSNMDKWAKPSIVLVGLSKNYLV